MALKVSFCVIQKHKRFGHSPPSVRNRFQRGIELPTNRREQENEQTSATGESTATQAVLKLQN